MKPDLYKGLLVYRFVRPRWLRFGLSGGVGFVVDSFVLLVLHHFLGVGALLARAGSFSAAVLVTWLLNRRYTFRMGAERASVREFLRYLTANCLGLVVNLAVYVLAISVNGYLGERPLLALVLAALCAAAVNYVAAARFVFVSRHP